MHKHDRWPRLSVTRWTAPMPTDETDAGGWAVQFEWLGFLIELGAGRRTAMWRDMGPEWAQLLRDIKGKPIAEQHARLKEMGGAHV